MKKVFVLFFFVFCIFYLNNKNELTPIVQTINTLFHQELNQKPNGTKQTVSLPIRQNKIITQETVKTIPKKNIAATSVLSNSASKYPMKTIQSYKISVINDRLVVTGKPTPYGEYYHANGIILYIQEQRSNTKTTIKVPFKNGTIHYEYPLHFNVGEVILNLNEYYKGETDNPNEVLGYVVYNLTDGDPYLLPSYMIQSNNPALINLAREITSGKTSELEKSRAIFEWVAKNVSYNYRLVNSPNPPLYSALQAYQSRDVLCSGYADLNAALHRAIGMDAKVLYGQNHAWNQIKISGRWQSEDPTYGSGFININTGKFVRSYQPVYFTKTDMHTEGIYPW